MEKSIYRPNINNLTQASKKLKKLINLEFKKSFRSHKPIAFLLSGGIDSSIIAKMAKKLKKKIKFFSFKSKSDNYDETKNINLLKKKLKLKHQYISSNKKQNYDILSGFISDFGFPLMSSTYLAYGSLCKKISAENYKVLVSGNGGDEMFSGYYAHHMSYLLSIKNKSYFNKKYNEWKNNTKPFVRLNVLKNLDEYRKVLKSNNPTFYENNEFNKFFNKKINYSFFKNKIFSKDCFINHLNKDLFEDSIPAQLHSIDNVSMYFSIESRAPYLSKDFFDFRNKLNKNLLIKKAKKLLQDRYQSKL